MTDDWRARRDLAVTRHAEAAANVRAREAAEARALIADFLTKARDLAPVRLKARSYSGGARYRTNVTGWYIHPDESIAIGVDGGFYLLSTVPSITAWFRGATVEPQEPLLIIGKGAKDGESISLKELLRRRLDAGDDWPRP
ncbi:hypothetical protein [Hamadaea tsunoensis]|uniref:hypothetical protein n=1 Tax=Hamadaea tsunoensis TaxID=53368 RepID=UPI000416CA5A|nr:hypothetical protein [Hamadaea tsunoensis]